MTITFFLLLLTIASPLSALQNMVAIKEWMQYQKDRKLVLVQNCRNQWKSRPNEWVLSVPVHTQNHLEEQVYSFLFSVTFDTVNNKRASFNKKYLKMSHACCLQKEHFTFLQPPLFTCSKSDLFLNLFYSIRGLFLIQKFLNKLRDKKSTRRFYMTYCGFHFFPEKEWKKDP